MSATTSVSKLCAMAGSDVAMIVLSSICMKKATATTAGTIRVR
ncbi:hypothetical protein [Sinorhizobium meliloti]